MPLDAPVISATVPSSVAFIRTFSLPLPSRRRHPARLCPHLGRRPGGARDPPPGQPGASTVTARPAGHGPAPGAPARRPGPRRPGPAERMGR